MYACTVSMHTVQVHICSGEIAGETIKNSFGNLWVLAAPILLSFGLLVYVCNVDFIGVGNCFELGGGGGGGGAMNIL